MDDEEKRTVFRCKEKRVTMDAGDSERLEERGERAREKTGGVENAKELEKLLRVH